LPGATRQSILVPRFDQILRNHSNTPILIMDHPAKPGGDDGLGNDDLLTAAAEWYAGT
jgi:hypothetical protein